MISAPNASVRNEIMIILASNLNRLFIVSDEKSSLSTKLFRNDEPEAKIKLKNPVKVIMPRPPI